MYAVIKTGGKQYKVTEGDVLQVEHLNVKGNKATLTPILVVNDDGKTIIGVKELKPYKVAVKLLGDAKGDKIDVLKYRPKSGYAVKSGHRQLYSLIEVTSIGQAQDKKEAEPKATEAPAPKATEAPAPKATEAPAPAEESTGEVT